MTTQTMTQTVAPAASATTAAAAPVSSSPLELAPHTVNGKVTTHIRIDDDWYDLTHWKASHPGGPLIIEQMNGNDATDAFYSLHSKEAAERLKRLPSSKQAPAHFPPSVAQAKPTQVALNFRKFRAQLEAEGWFERSVMWEAFYTGSVYFLGAFGTWLTLSGYPVLGVIAIALGMQQAGWIGHDYIHARGSFAYWNAVCMQWMNGFSRVWWSNKHNTHHVYTNYIGIDADIENDPVFHLFFPDPKDDTFFRKMQHWYFVPVASVLYYSWRVQSLQTALANADKRELFFMLLNYIWMYILGWKVALASIYLAGALVAIIVTVTHQSEEMVDPLAAETPAYSFVEAQFSSTRDARTSDFFTEWLWGGMQYQLEHHLFPTMPKYHYRQIAPKVEAFAKANGVEYRVDHSQWKIFVRNFMTLKHYAQPTAAVKSD